MKYLCIVFIFVFTIADAKAAENGQIDKGEFLFQKLYTKNEAVVPINLNSVIDIMYYLYSKVPAKNYGKGFLSGNIILEDPEYKFFDYLQRYVRKRFSGDMYKENLVAFCDAYPRASTHFNNYYVYTKKAKKNLFTGVTKTNCDYVHYGIDISDNLQLPIQEKKHILFGKIGVINGKQMMFVKFEEVGVHGMQVVQHLFNLVKKYWSEHKNNLTTDYRREDIPKSIMAEFVQLINSSQLNLDNKKRDQILRQVKACGIRAMVKIMQVYTNIDTIKIFIDKLKKLYPDYTYRFGNEIILFHNELI